MVTSGVSVLEQLRTGLPVVLIGLVTIGRFDDQLFCIGVTRQVKRS